jgi:hypothetical protein
MPPELSRTEVSPEILARAQELVRQRFEKDAAAADAPAHTPDDVRARAISENAAEQIRAMQSSIG